MEFSDDFLSTFSSFLQRFVRPEPRVSGHFSAAVPTPPCDSRPEHAACYRSLCVAGIFDRTIASQLRVFDGTLREHLVCLRRVDALLAESAALRSASRCVACASTGASTPVPDELYEALDIVNDVVRGAVVAKDSITPQGGTPLTPTPPSSTLPSQATARSYTPDMSKDSMASGSAAGGRDAEHFSASARSLDGAANAIATSRSGSAHVGSPSSTPPSSSSSSSTFVVQDASPSCSLLHAILCLQGGVWALADGRVPTAKRLFEVAAAHCMAVEEDPRLSPRAVLRQVAESQGAPIQQLAATRVVVRACAQAQCVCAVALALLGCGSNGAHRLSQSGLVGLTPPSSGPVDRVGSSMRDAKIVSAGSGGGGGAAAGPLGGTVVTPVKIAAAASLSSTVDAEVKGQRRGGGGGVSVVDGLRTVFRSDPLTRKMASAALTACLAMAPGCGRPVPLCSSSASPNLDLGALKAAYRRLGAALEPRSLEGIGKGLFALRPIRGGETILAERPLMPMQPNAVMRRRRRRDSDAGPLGREPAAGAPVEKGVRVPARASYMSDEQARPAGNSADRIAASSSGSSTASVDTTRVCAECHRTLPPATSSVAPDTFERGHAGGPRELAAEGGGGRFSDTTAHPAGAWMYREGRKYSVSSFPRPRTSSFGGADTDGISSHSRPPWVASSEYRAPGAGAALPSGGAGSAASVHSYDGITPIPCPRAAIAGCDHVYCSYTCVRAADECSGHWLMCGGDGPSGWQRGSFRGPGGDYAMVVLGLYAKIVREVERGQFEPGDCTTAAARGGASSSWSGADVHVLTPRSGTGADGAGRASVSAPHGRVWTRTEAALERLARPIPTSLNTAAARLQTPSTCSASSAAASEVGASTPQWRRWREMTLGVQSQRSDTVVHQPTPHAALGSAIAAADQREDFEAVRLHLERFPAAVAALEGSFWYSFDGFRSLHYLVQVNAVTGGLWLLSSFFNHACRPNAAFDISDNGQNVLRVVALRDIKVTISYLGDAACTSVEARRARLSSIYLFLCTCALCMEESGDSDPLRRPSSVDVE